MSESEINDMLKHSPEDGHRALFDQYFVPLVKWIIWCLHQIINYCKSQRKKVGPLLNRRGFEYMYANISINRSAS